MKVAVATWFPVDPQRPSGGVEAASVNLVRHLAGLDGLEVHVVTMDRGLDASATPEWEGATVHRLQWAGGRMLTNAREPGRRQVQEYLHHLRPDVVHAHDTYGIMVQGLAMPRVFTIHGFIHADTLVAGGRGARVRSWLWRRAEHSAWADQPHIISISPYVRERLAGIARGIIHDIDNPVGEAFFQVNHRERKGTIFSAGVVSPGKNTLRVVEALAKVTRQQANAELRLAGYIANEDYGKAVHAAIRRERLQNRVHILGRISAAQVREELAAVSVFVLASLQENSPVCIEEAMVAGVPVVTSNRCGMPYMVRDGESGFLVDPEDPDDIAWRLGQLLQDDDLRRRMGRKGREIALDRFDPDKVARRTLEVYRRAVRDHQRRNRCGSRRGGR